MTNETPFSTGIGHGGGGSFPNCLKNGSLAEQGIAIFAFGEIWVPLGANQSDGAEIFSGRKESPGGFEKYWGMKITRINGRHGPQCLIRLTQADWEGIDDSIDRTERDKPVETMEQPSSEPTLLPEMDRLEVEVEKYTDRTWAVNVNGELLCVTAYRKGAYAVRELLERLWKRIAAMTNAANGT